MIRFFLWTYFLLAALVSSAQQSPALDTLYQSLSSAKSTHDSCDIYESIVFEWLNTDVDKAIEESVFYVALAERGGLKKDMANALNARGNAHIRKRSYKEGITDMLQSLEILRELNDSSSVSVACTNLANVMNVLSNHSSAMEYLLEAEKHLISTTTKSQRAHLNSQLAVSFRNLKRFNESQKHFEIAISGFEMEEDFVRANKVRMSYGILFTMMKKYAEADSIFNVLEEHYFTQEDKTELALLQENMGNNFLEWKKFEEAEMNYLHAKKFWMERNSDYDLAIIDYELAECYNLWGRLNNVAPHATSSLRICDSLGIRDYAMKNHKVLASVYDKLRLPEKSLLHFKLATALEDSLQLDDKELHALSLHATYEADKRKKEIELLQIENSLSEERAGKQKLYTRLSIAGGIMLLLIGLLLFNRIRTKQHIRELELRNKIANDLHDEVGSSLSSIRMLSEISLSSDSLEKSKPLLERISANSKDTVESISDIVWSINPRNDEQESMAQRMLHYLDSVCIPKNIRVQFEDDVLYKTKFDMQQRKNIYLIFKEAVNNALKYGDPKSLRIKLAERGKSFVMEVTDDGRGFDTSKNSEAGNGIRSMKTRTDELNGKLEMDSRPGAGTNVLLTIPFPRTR